MNKRADHKKNRGTKRSFWKKLCFLRGKGLLKAEVKTGVDELWVRIGKKGQETLREFFNKKRGMIALKSPPSSNFKKRESGDERGFLFGRMFDKRKESLLEEG